MAPGRKYTAPAPGKETIMKRLLAQVRAFIQDEEGASAVEYGLLIAGIAVAVMGAIYTIGTNMNTKFNSVADKLSGS
jgi:pilus assembly protein Flp/PilA